MVLCKVQSVDQRMECGVGLPTADVPSHASGAAYVPIPTSKVSPFDLSRVQSKTRGEPRPDDRKFVVVRRATRGPTLSRCAFTTHSDVFLLQKSIAGDILRLGIDAIWQMSANNSGSAAQIRLNFVSLTLGTMINGNDDRKFQSVSRRNGRSAHPKRNYNGQGR